MSQISVIFGVSGSRKTTSLGAAAEYLYERTGGRIGRAIYTDGGGYQAIRGVVDAGLVEPYNIQDEGDLPVLIHKLARGYWPAKLEGGLRPKGTLLHPPTAETWRQVGFYLYEGLTSTSELMMKYLRDRQISIGGDPVGKFEAKDFITSDGAGKSMLFCANNMKHYDWVQGEMLAVLAELAGLPVERVLVTAHEASGSDEDTRDPIRGPALVGKAGTSKIAKNVADCIHYEIFMKKAGELMATDVRAYYQSHPDPKFPTVLYNCKVRIPAEQIGALQAGYPGGFFSPGDLGKFLADCDKLTGVAGDLVQERKRAIDLRLAAKQA